ncbi:hypothetical protein EJ06DRAFT_582273 [Trichodelitschia bisporula]|uniref:Myosin-1 n=1 Tax=Trichodelitschia bisporula TaxID=703511 RepID=A0A6G1HWQ7_9PEZI|nr:hypothetical protein EJ06DRAFT_582273 [Trichodelitschia bisporula]
MSVHAEAPPPIVREPSHDVHYVTGKYLGKGGFAICYRAELYDGKPSGKIVALKIVRSKMEPPKLAQKFATELQLHSKLHHANIVGFHRAFSFEQNTYVVLELCENGSLADALRARKYFTMPEIRRFIIQTCGAVKYLHHRNIVHRDLKTGNLFLDKDMNVKVGDFGLAAMLVSKNDMGARRTTMCGTPNYLAPEILEKGGKGHNEKVDIWAIGIIAYTLAVGKAPFHAPKREDIYKKLQNREYEWPTKDKCPNDISTELKNLVSSLLVHEDDRPVPDKIVSHPFFRLQFVPDHLEGRCLTHRPNFPNDLPSRTTTARGYSDSWARICKASGVGEYGPGLVFPLAGGKRVVSVIKDVEKEIAAGRQPLVPIPVGTVYVPFPDRTDRVDILQRRPTYLDGITEERESSAEANQLVEISGNEQPVKPSRLPARKAATRMPKENAPPSNVQQQPEAAPTDARRARSIRRNLPDAKRELSPRPARRERLPEAKPVVSRQSPISDDSTKSDALGPVRKISRETAPPTEVPATTTVRTALDRPARRCRTLAPSQSKAVPAPKKSAEAIIAISNSIPARPKLEAAEPYKFSDPANVLAQASKLRDNIASALASKGGVPGSDTTTKKLPFVSKWVDYARKHGIGYILEDGTIGCIFNATSRSPVTHTFVRNGYGHLPKENDAKLMANIPFEMYTNCPGNELKKLTLTGDRLGRIGVLWAMFARYMCQQLGQAEKLRAEMEPETQSETLFVHFYERMSTVGVWGFSDGSFQFNFPDHTKLVLSADGKYCDFTCISVEGILHWQQTEDLPFKYIRNREVLSASVSSLLNRSKGSATAELLEFNLFRQKLCFVEAVTTRWVSGGGLGKSPEGSERMKWDGPQLEKGKKEEWVTAVTKRAGRKKDGGSGHADRGRGGGVSKGPIKRAVFESTKKKEVGVSDLTLISKISNEAINDNLKKRFENGEIYTYIGHVLVSVNPFRDLGLYTETVLDSYRGKNRLEMPPHVFAIAEASYYNMKGYNENQCIIISGESGAGKTEAAKRIMQYIASVSGGNDSSIQEIKEMVLATNPLLESFGNAKTLRNNNSSRFGKYLEIQFNSRGEPVGANINNYLLEKSRVVGQITNERNFHIFYQFTKAASSSYRETFGVQEPKSYVYTSRSKCFDVDGIDDHADFKETLNAMKVIGLSQAEQDDLFRMLAAILWLGNVSFVENNEGNAAIADQSVVQFVAYLLEVDAAHVDKALTLRVVETSRGGRRGSIYDVPLNPAQATAVRDALSKAIYFNMFDWIVQRVNASLKARGAMAQSIGILDIYGFEIFEKNSFEQLCINYVNEKLQQIFIQLTLKAEQEEYEREQIQWTPIKYFDNKVVCDLIEERKPPGVFAALNDACATAHADPTAADQTFVQRLNALSSNQHFQPRQGQFIIKHYAGDVSYAVTGMTDKNKDQLLKDLLQLVGQSGNRFLHTLFPAPVDQDNKRRPPTAGDKIKQSANDLVATLMKASPSYIRTIKPNENKSPSEYNQANVLHQIKYLGLQENVRIRRAGFAYRQTFEKFVERFYLLSPKTSYAGDYTWTGDYLSGTKQILKDTNIPVEEYQMGVSKAFIKTPETLFALEAMRDRYWHNMAIRIQRAWRNYVRYRTECAIRIQRFWRRINGGLEFIQLRDQGHKVLAGRKERRRFSLLGSRRFLGDYLGIANRGGPGEIMRNSLDIGANENVLFSCRAEVLVSKLGRSSKPEARSLILTNKSVYIVKQVLVNRQVQIQAERAIPLGALRFVSCSNLKDDWFALGVGSAQEPDALVNCIFKTEFFTHLRNATRGATELRIGSSVEYNKKPGKLAVVKVMKDPNVPRDDLYKSGSIHTSQGEPANSVSRPTPRGKQVAGRPITKGKLLRPGGPGGAPSKVRPAQTQSAAQAKVVPQPMAVQNGAGHARNASASAVRTPPPPPPPAAAPPAAREPTYRVLYDFNGQTEGEMSVGKNDVVIVMQKEGNGWWLAKKPDSSASGWVPSAYMEEVVAQAPPPPPPPPPVARPVPAAPATNGVNGAAARGKPTPPAPPSKRPAGKKPVPAPMAESRDSGYSGSGASNAGAARDSGGSVAGSLAEALRQRQAAMHSRRNEDDDW